MTTFYNFTLKIETSWAKKVAKSILETWNVNVVVYLGFIYFRIEKMKYTKKNNVQCKKFTIYNLNNSDWI